MSIIGDSIFPKMPIMVYISTMSKRKPDPKSPLRNKFRLQQHRYGENRRGYGKGYTAEEIQFFIDHNQKTANGRYEFTDVLVAQKMGISLATVQYLRRKFNMVMRMRVSQDKLLEYMVMSEKTLSEMCHAQSEAVPVLS